MLVGRLLLLMGGGWDGDLVSCNYFLGVMHGSRTFQIGYIKIYAS
jgi:hypothetical protein